MDIDRISTFAALLLALSLAAERLVEIVKAPIPFLKEGDPRALPERWRRIIVHVLSVGAGIAVAYMARPAIPDDVIATPKDNGTILALGLLASGGSGMWNSVLGYLEGVKKVRKDLLDGVKGLGAENTPAGDGGAGRASGRLRPAGGAAEDAA